MIASSQNETLTVMITGRRDEAEGIISLELTPADGASLPRFEAGAHVDVHVAPDLVRQYSLCNDPAETHRYVLGILRDAGSRGGSAAVHAGFIPGESVRIGRPRNNFRLEESATHSILLAGGIGITPLLAMAWRLHVLGASFELHYCTRSLSRTAFRDLLREVPFADRVRLHLDDGPEDQRLEVDSVLARPGAGAHVYACGPSGFLDHVLGAAERFGWPEERIHREYFSAEVKLGGGEFTVRAAKSGLSLAVPAGRSIAEVLQEHGVAVPLSCEQGVCGTCLTPVLGGEPDHRDQYLTDAEKTANDQMMLCCSRAKTPVLVLDI